jgi:hypothetical protein
MAKAIFLISVYPPLVVDRRIKACASGATANSPTGLLTIALDFDDGFSINALNSVMPLQGNFGENAISTGNIGKEYATLASIESLLSLLKKRALYEEEHHQAYQRNTPVL